MVSAGCQGSVSVFTVDYDAPISGATNAVRKSLQPLVSYANGTGNGTGELTFQVLFQSCHISSFEINVTTISLHPSS